MRIAVYFSGQPRFLEENSEQIKRNLIGPFGADVFFHFWKNSLNDTSGRENQGQSHFSWEKAEKIYQPKKFLIEDHPDIAIMQLADKYMFEVFDALSPKDFWFQRDQAFRVLSQICSTYKSNQLKKEYEKEQGFVYDYVIFTRTDFLFPRAVSFQDFPAKPGMITVLPDWRNGKRPLTPLPGKEIPGPGSCPGNFAIGRSFDMDLYAETINSLPAAVVAKQNLGGEGFVGFSVYRHGLQLCYSDLCSYQSFYSPPAGEDQTVSKFPRYPTQEEIYQCNRKTIEMFPNLFRFAKLSDAFRAQQEKDSL